jgi:hypothetical protein
MMRYSETTFCRTRFLREYFGEDTGKDCGHCDNCRSKVAGDLAAPPTFQASPNAEDGAVAAQLMPQIAAESGPKLFHIGDRVRHRRFGTGQVLEIAGTNLTVDFGHSGRKRIRRDYVRLAN